MPWQHPSRSRVRDALLVVMIVALAFALGAVASELEVGATMIPGSGAMGGSADSMSAGPVLDPGTHPPSRSSIAPERTSATHDGPGIAPLPVPAPTRAPSIPAERFMGEGAGRDHLATADPLGHRAYILDTAGLMYRRGWMGRDGRVAKPAANGFDNPSPPAAKHGPE